MVKRLHLMGWNGRGDDWVEERREFGGTYLFEGRTRYRQLRVMIDDELLADFSYPPTLPGFLSELLANRFVRAWRYSDDGPPTDPPPAHGVYSVGWANVVERSGDYWAVACADEDSRWFGGVGASTMRLASEDVRSGVYADLGATAAAARREADALAAGVAGDALHADIFITERPYLHERQWATSSTTVCSVEEAVALVGLYLRAQGEFRVSRDFGYDRGMFFWVATRDLLPEGWRWFSACVHSASNGGDDSVELLGNATLDRVNRSLRARDRLCITLNRPQTNSTIDEILEALDIILLMLMGSVDATARVAHHALGLGGSPRLAAWHRSDQRWFKDMHQAAPRLASVVGKGSAGGRTLWVLSTLRNSVHGEAMQSAVVSVGSRAETCEVRIPRADEQKLLSAIDELGGREAWGIRSSALGHVAVEPDVLADKLITLVTDVLNEVMRATPVEQLPRLPPGIDLGTAAGPDADGPLDTFGATNRLCVRWQLGLGR